MNFEDGYVQEENKDNLEVGKTYVIQVKDLKKFSYTNLHEPVYDFDLPYVLDEEEKYKKVYTPVLSDYGNIMDRIRLENAVLLVEYLENGMLQDLNSGMLFHIIQYSETFRQLDDVAENILRSGNSFMYIFPGYIYEANTKMEKKHNRTLKKIDEFGEKIYDLNNKAERFSQINFINLRNKALIEEVHQGDFVNETPTLVKKLK